MSSFLPSFVSFFLTVNNDKIFLQPNQLLINYVEEEGAVTVGPNTRFTIVQAHRGVGVVHLRHTTTNRYLARGAADQYIVAGGVEPVEDESAPGCTLFRYQIQSGNRVSFVHVQSGLAVRVLHVTNPARRSYWVLDGVSGAVPLVTEFFDLETFVNLPKRVVFKGDNNKYLIESIGNSVPTDLRFTADDAAHPLAQFEIVLHRRGYTTIKGVSSGLFWDALYTFVYAWSFDNKKPESWFTAVNGPNNTIGFRGNVTTENLFCERRDDGGLPILVCAAPSLLAGGRLKVEEPVVRRTVYVDFKMDNSRIYNMRPVLAATGTTSNQTDIEQSYEFDVGYTVTKSSTWNNTVRVMAGIKTTFSTGVPFIAKGEIETTVELEYQHEWGGSESTEVRVGNKPVVTIPPWTRATVNVLGTEGNCNIPFSYRQVDELLSGGRVETVLHDGVYENVTSYDFTNIIQMFPIDKPKHPKNFESSEPEFHFTRDYYESLVEIYKAKVAYSRSGKVNLEEPTIIVDLKMEKQ